MPLRPFENGRQKSGVITRSASQASIALLVMWSSVPPTTATSTTPARTICMPMPIACVDEEQAETTAKLGPCRP